MKHGFVPCLRGELWKVFHARALYIALTVGLLIQLYNVLYNIEYVRHIYILEEVNGPSHGGGETRSLFILWLSATANLEYFLFRWLFPLLAMVPYGWSCRSEARMGYRNQVLARVSKGSYFIAKYIGAFVSGAVVIAVPLGVNLLLNAMVCPAVVPPSYSMVVPIHPADIMYLLFFSHPWVYSLLWLGISTLWGGTMAGLSMFLSQFMKRSIFILIIPCVFVYYSAYVLRSWDIASMFMITASNHRTYTMLLSEMGAVTALGLFGGWAIFSQKEIL